MELIGGSPAHCYQVKRNLLLSHRRRRKSSVRGPSVLSEGRPSCGGPNGRGRERCVADSPSVFTHCFSFFSPIRTQTNDFFCRSEEARCQVKMINLLHKPKKRMSTFSMARPVGVEVNGFTRNYTQWVADASNGMVSAARFRISHYGYLSTWCAVIDENHRDGRNSSI